MGNLGKGLSALLGDADLIYDEKLEEKELSLELLSPGKYQPRHKFKEEHLKSLAESIKKNGVLQPLLVRAIDDNKYEIIAGERRYRASKLAGLSTVPVVIKNFNDNQAIEIALIENLQREDLSSIEEALGYKKMMDEFGYTQEQIGKAVDKSRSHIANLLRLLNLPDVIKQMLENEDISMGHARALLSAEEPEELAKIIMSKQLSVRQTEKLVASQKKGSKVSPNNEKIRVENMSASDIVARIQKKTKLNAFVNQESYNKGSVTISYESFSDLEKILNRLGK
ncbi:MAG: ParB/RepB/Spo0J family partition protein [Alphaproteobacteria bacterium]|jgi:ParB family chromosome partitioning protein|nr:ParB/RepB/Spo0J family partition protein [Alphaproteobacteria bacterium]